MRLGSVSSGAMTKRVEFTSKAGTCAGELAEAPATAAKVGGVVVIQEWHGITDQIREKVERIAKEGFVAIAPDLYHGKVAKDDDEAGKMMNALDFGKAPPYRAHRRRAQARIADRFDRDVVFAPARP